MIRGRRLPSVQQGYARSALESQYPQLWRGLVAAYPFGMVGSGNSVYDFSLNGNPGSLLNGAAWKSGFGRNGIEFNPVDDAVEIASSSELELTNHISLVARACLYSSNASGRKIICKYHGGATANTNYRLQMYPATLGVTFNIGVGSSSSDSVSTGVVPDLNRWYHVCGTYDRTLMRVFIDGVFSASKSQTSSIRSTTYPLLIGNSGQSTGGAGTDNNRNFDGLIDDVLIYNRALSAEEVHILYEIPYAPFVKRRRIYATGGGGDITVTPTAEAVASSTADPTVILGSLAVAPNAEAVAASTVDPTVSLSSLVVAPNAEVVVSSLVDPTVILSSLVATPSVETAASSTVDPVITITGSVIVAPTAEVAVSSTIDPMIELGDLIVTPTVEAAVSLIVDPMIELGDLTVAPNAEAAASSTVDPTVQGGGNVTVAPTAEAAASSIVDPLVILGSLSVAPTAEAAASSIVDPTVILGSLTITPNAEAATSSTVDPTVDESGNITVTPSAEAVVSSTVDPTVILGSLMIAPSAEAGASSTVDPTVMLTSLTIAPNAEAVLASTVDPAVILGSLTVAPSVEAAASSTVDPTVILGSLTVAPNVEAVASSTVDPTVNIAGSNVTVTPNPEAAISSTVDPAVFLGNLDIAPIPVEVLAATVNPTVLGGLLASTVLAVSQLQRTHVGHKWRITGYVELSPGSGLITPRQIGLARIDDFFLHPTGSAYQFEFDSGNVVFTTGGDGTLYQFEAVGH